MRVEIEDAKKIIESLCDIKRKNQDKFLNGSSIDTTFLNKLIDISGSDVYSDAIIEAIQFLTQWKKSNYSKFIDFKEEDKDIILAFFLYKFLTKDKGNDQETISD